MIKFLKNFSSRHYFKRFGRGLVYGAILIIPPLLPFFLFSFYDASPGKLENDLHAEITRDALEKDFPTYAPQKIFKIGMYINDLSNVQVADRSFGSRFVFWTKNFYDKSTNDRAKLAEGAIRLVNADEISSELRGERSAHYASYESSGTLKNEFYLPDYPFDTHKLRFIFEPRDMTAEDIILTADENSSLSSNVSLGEWEIKSFQARSEVATAQSDFSDPSLIEKGSLWRFVPRVIFEVEIQRKIFSHLIKELLPLLIIMLMAYTNLFVEPDEFDSKIEVAFTAFLSVAALHWVATADQVGGSYLTAMDQFFLVGFSLVMLLSVEALVSRELAEEQDEVEKKVYPRWFKIVIPALKIVYPLLLVGGWYWIAWQALV